MEKWFVPDHMKALANTTVRCFGYDNTNAVDYQFNELGFRNKYHHDTSINVIGNSIAFGIGLAEQQTFGYLLSQKIGLPCNNFSFGCYFHENHDYLKNLKILAQRNTNDIFVVQLNNLDRYRVDKNSVTAGLTTEFSRSRFLDYFDQLLAILEGKRSMLLYWDDQDHNLPKSIQDQILIFNKFHLDHSIGSNKNTFGPQSHNAIAKILTSSYLTKFN
jgi:hypothetical protein